MCLIVFVDNNFFCGSRKSGISAIISRIVVYIYTVNPQLRELPPTLALCLDESTALTYARALILQLITYTAKACERVTVGKVKRWPRNGLNITLTSKEAPQQWYK